MDRLLQAITYLEKLGKLGDRQAWLGRVAAHRAKLEGLVRLTINSFLTALVRITCDTFSMLVVYFYWR